MWDAWNLAKAISPKRTFSTPTFFKGRRPRTTRYKSSRRGSTRYAKTSGRPKYITYTKRRRLKPLRKSTKKNVKYEIQRALNLQTEVKFIYRSHLITAMDGWHGGSTVLDHAFQIGTVGNLVEANIPGNGIPRITAAQTADLQGHRKGRAVYFINLQIKIQFKVPAECRHGILHLWVVSTKNNDVPDYKDMYSTDFTKSTRVFKSENPVDSYQRKLCYRRYYVSTGKIVRTVATEVGDPAVTIHIPYRTTREVKRVVNLRFKNYKAEAAKEEVGVAWSKAQNKGLWVIYMVEVGKPFISIPPNVFPRVQMDNYLFYRDL